MRPTEDIRQHLASIVEGLGMILPEKCSVEPPKDPKFGDLSTNVALLLAKKCGKKPADLANDIASALCTQVEYVESATTAGPGFLNITLAPSYWQRVVTEVEEKGSSYGKSTVGRGKKVLLEFVSANPTGPLHVGHGRGAAVGDSLARLLSAVGYAVDKEYYINDAGRQMRLLGLSIWLRARESRGLPVEWPEEFYRGEYIKDIARDLLQKEPDLLSLSDEEGQDHAYRYGMQTIMDGIKQDLQDFRVVQDSFFSEKSLVSDNAVDRAFKALDTAGLTYVKDDAYWFAATRFGDEKDRVLRKSDGSLTYFASDIAYHHNKFERGYSWLIDVWGADHHGYIPRMRAAIEAMGHDPSSFNVILIQLVNLIKDGNPVSMSTRAGTFETLSDVVKEVGTDASRFMFLFRKSDSPLDFDLDLVRQRNLENPVYYVQYAHARICQLLARAGERGIRLPECSAEACLATLTGPLELGLLRKIAAFTDCLVLAADSLGVHHVSRYLTDLAGLVHSFYAQVHILGGTDDVHTLAQLLMMRAVGTVLRAGLDILGVTAPDTM
ncbi:MAG: arginine--tRNA ligase [Desulfovibrio sp.]|nr:arginine--tRNA ligase [Desulfovibrio sp.]